MSNKKSSVAFQIFMGDSPVWYKQGLVFCLILNPVLFITLTQTIGIELAHQIVGWLLLVEFIGTLALALSCYPLIPGGMLAIEATAMGMVTPHGIYHEVEANLEVILLLLFMVAGIHFMKDLLSWIFTRLIVSIKSKILLSLTFTFVGAFLSAWLDALTVTAVMIAVAIAFYNIYTGAELQFKVGPEGRHLSTDQKKETARKDLDTFSGFLRNLMMHGVVGTAMGGVATQVGEPQNLIIASKMDWSFAEFYLKVAHVSTPVLIFGLLTTILLERIHIFGYGSPLPDNVRRILQHEADRQKSEMDSKKRWNLWVQGVVGIWLIVGLALHLAEVGLIGLSVVILLTTFTGKTHEDTIGHAFEEATPFTSLLVVFFVIVAMIEEVHLFQPIIEIALQTKGELQPYMFFGFSGLLSAISDNVFVGTIYIKETFNAFVTPENLGITAEQFKLLVEKKDEAKLLSLLKENSPAIFKQLSDIAVSINVGTNIPSIATPNGQAAFLFLLTNAIAVRIKLSYFRMVIMALPYFIVLSIVAALFLMFHWLPV